LKDMMAPPPSPPSPAPITCPESTVLARDSDRALPRDALRSPGVFATLPAKLREKPNLGGKGGEGHTNDCAKPLTLGAIGAPLIHLPTICSKATEIWKSCILSVWWWWRNGGASAVPHDSYQTQLARPQ
jgi:hypothetical protein